MRVWGRWLAGWLRGRGWIARDRAGRAGAGADGTGHAENGALRRRSCSPHHLSTDENDGAGGYLPPPGCKGLRRWQWRECGVYGAMADRQAWRRSGADLRRSDLALLASGIVLRELDLLRSARRVLGTPG